MMGRDEKSVGLNPAEIDQNLLRIDLYAMGLAPLNSANSPYFSDRSSGENFFSPPGGVPQKVALPCNPPFPMAITVAKTYPL